MSFSISDGNVMPSASLSLDTTTGLVANSHTHSQDFWGSRPHPAVIEVTVSNGALFAELKGREKVQLVAQSETSLNGEPAGSISYEERVDCLRNRLCIASFRHNFASLFNDEAGQKRIFSAICPIRGSSALRNVPNVRELKFTTFSTVLLNPLPLLVSRKFTRLKMLKNSVRNWTL